MQVSRAPQLRHLCAGGIIRSLTYPLDVGLAAHLWLREDDALAVAERRPAIDGVRNGSFRQLCVPMLYVIAGEVW